MLIEDKFKVKRRDFNNMRFILASTMRNELLIHMLDNCDELKELRESFNKPSATILHAIKELESLDLITKNYKQYCATSKGALYGFALDKLQKNLYLFESNREFWESHQINSFPIEFINNAYLLNDSKYHKVNKVDLSEYLEICEKSINSSKDIGIILPIFSQGHMDIILNHVKEGHALDLIVNSEVLNSIKKTGYFKKLIELSENDLIHLRKYSGDLKLFLIYGSELMMMNLFKKDGSFDDGLVVYNDTEPGVLWAREIFDFYYKNSNQIIL